MSKVHRENNFDFLRLLFSSLVIISHSFPLTGIREQEILMQVTNNQADFGGLSVKAFFIISGFLIFQSLERSRSYTDYLWKRILRLFPALLVMGIFILLVIALFLYKSDVPILENYSFLTYFPRVLSLFFLQGNIDGVFQDLPYQTINGSLWTLCYEFSMYITISILFFVKNRRWRFYFLALLFIIFFLLMNLYPAFLNKRLFSLLEMNSYNFYDLGIFFVAGALLTYVNFKATKIQKILFYVFIVIIILSVFFRFYSIAKYLFLPYIIIYFGVSSTPVINKIGTTIGDTSYGIYIYGWFVQQFLLETFQLATYPLMIFSLLITFVLGYASWHLVEKRALTYKNFFQKTQNDS
jgi:peptidoglycan/LPS O-acetylase OafA/YrhL